VAVELSVRDQDRQRYLVNFAERHDRSTMLNWTASRISSGTTSQPSLIPGASVLLTVPEYYDAAGATLEGRQSARVVAKFGIIVSSRRERSARLQPREQGRATFAGQRMPRRLCVAWLTIIASALLAATAFTSTPVFIDSNGRV